MLRYLLCSIPSFVAETSKIRHPVSQPLISIPHLVRLSHTTPFGRIRPAEAAAIVKQTMPPSNSRISTNFVLNFGYLHANRLLAVDPHSLRMPETSLCLLS